MKLTTLCIFLSLSLTFPAVGQPTPDCINMHVIHNAPIGFKVEGKPTVGVHWEYLAAIEELTGICINKELMPYARIWQNLKYGNHDGGIVFKSPSRSKLVDYVALIRTVKTVVIPVKNIQLAHASDLNNIVIGKTRGTHLSKSFDNDLNLNVIELNNYAQAAKMIKRGRIDAIAGSALVLSYQLEKHNILEKVDLKQVFVLGEKEQWLQLSKQSSHSDKSELLKQTVEELKLNGKFTEIMNKYYGDRWQAINH